MFLDRSDIAGGDNWRERIEASLSKAKVVLAIIGPTWLTAAGEFGFPLIHEEDDVLAYEFSVGLHHGGIVTIPLYIHGTNPLPERAFPKKLADLAQKQWIEFDIGRNFETLVARIEQILGVQSLPGGPRQNTSEFFRALVKPLNFDLKERIHLGLAPILYCHL